VPRPIGCEDVAKRLDCVSDRVRTLATLGDAVLKRDIRALLLLLLLLLLERRA
jgi:hypothetical protein